MALPRRVVMVSFEGPDRYATVGGLSTRVTQLARAFGAAGSHVDLIFAGDPAAAAVEEYAPNVMLRRWSQWISASHPRNAYDGEMDKVADWESSVPAFVVDSILVPAAATHERTLVIAEEWQTANVAIGIDALARLRGLRNVLTLIWNANSTHGWKDINWAALRAAAAITVPSKYMRGELRRIGVSALVVPNGIDTALHEGADSGVLAKVKRALGKRPTLVKVGRFEADKNWIQAVDALAELHAGGIDARLIARGRYNAYAEHVFQYAGSRGLGVERLDYAGIDGDKVIEGIALSDRPILHLRSFLDEAMLAALYAAADAVLANSGREPFGLVGLEVIAAGGIAVCGSTGEEYADPFVNAIVCDTSDGRELASYLRALLANPALADGIRRVGAETAERYSWGHSLTALDLKIDYIDAITV
ncbi:MAG: glycosyltransferase family 4 protein [Candidatus Lustribacter sp.]